MKILVVSQYFWPENFRLNDLCAELQSRGHEITVLTGKPNYPNGELFPEYASHPQHFNKYKGVDIIRVPMLMRGSSRLSLALNYLSFMISCTLWGAWQVRKLNFETVFVCQLSPATVAIPALVIAKMKSLPIAMWILDLWPDSLSGVGVIKNTYFLGFFQRCMNFIYSKQDLILVQSKSFQKKIINLNIDIPRVEYIPTWTEDIYQRSGPSKQRINKGDKFIVTFAGNIGEAQDVLCVIKAANILKQHSNICFWIIGDGREVDSISNAIRQYELQTTVMMLGRRPLEEMPEYFTKSDAMVLTLKAEEVFAMTIPGKLQSYLAAGKAIVGAIDGEAQHIIHESGAGFCVSSGDYVGLAEAVLKLSKLSQNELYKYGQNARVYYEQEFNRTLVINKFENQLRQIIS